MSSIKVSFRMAGSGQVRAVASTASDFSVSPVYSPYVTIDPVIGWGVCKLDGLAPGTLYYIKADYSGIASSVVGTARTPPAGAHNFGFAAASCWNQYRPNKYIYDAIKAKIDAGTVDFIFHLGDFHYSDIQVDDASIFRGVVDDVFSVSSKRHMLLRAAPVYYMYDDHDCGGPDNGAAGDPGSAGGIKFFRGATPNPDFADTSPTAPPYYTFKRGRVRFVVTDVRNDNDPVAQTDNSSKRKMRSAQETWFKATILAAAAADEPVFWVATNPWIDTAGATDTWGGYSTHRTELANWFTANGLTNKVAIISGDAHMLAYDNGTNSAGGLKVMQCAPWDQLAGAKGGPYTHGPFITRENQCGHITVTDPGSGAVSVRFRGLSFGSSTEAVDIDQTFLLG